MIRAGQILVIRGGGLGDFLLTLPALRALRQSLTPRKLAIIGYPRILKLVENRYYAEEIRSLDTALLAPFFLKDGELPEVMASYIGGFDLIVSWLPDHEGIFSENLRRTGAGRVLSPYPFPAPGEKKHIVDHLIESLAPLKIPSCEREPRIFLNSEDRERAEDLLSEYPGKEDSRRSILAIHPGSGGRHKCWPVERFAAIANRAATDLGVRVLLLCGPADQEVTQMVLREVKGTPPLVIKGLPLLDLAAFLERCSCYLGNDSGISHLAAAVGCPTVALFGPSDPGMWGVRGRGVCNLFQELDCRPCSREKYQNCLWHQCWELLKVDEIKRVILAAIQK